MSQLAEDRVQQGRDAYHGHAWHDAFDLLRQVDAETSLTPEDLAFLAESAWFAGDPDAAIEARERAHAGYLGQGDKCHAAEIALQLALDHFERLESAVGNGWLGRAARLLDQTPNECAAHGWQATTLAYLAMRIRGDTEEGLRQARLAQELGERLGVPAIQALALQGQGRALINLGKIDEGLALIDESAIAAISGELDPLTTGKIYCSRISICRSLADWRAQLSGPMLRSGGATGRTSRDFRESAGCSAPRLWIFEAPGPTLSGRRSVPARSSAVTTCW